MIREIERKKTRCWKTVGIRIRCSRRVSLNRTDETRAMREGGMARVKTCQTEWNAFREWKKGEAEETGDVCGNSVNLAENQWGELIESLLLLLLFLCCCEEKIKPFFFGPPVHRLAEKRFTMISAKGNRIRILRSRFSATWTRMPPRYLRCIFNDPGPGLRLMASLTLNEHLRQL